MKKNNNIIYVPEEFKKFLEDLKELTGIEKRSVLLKKISRLDKKWVALLFGNYRKQKNFKF